MAEEHPTHATAVENGKSAYAVDIAVAEYTLLGDEPVSAGGAGLGPAPYDLLTAALAECTSMTVRWYAKQKNWPLDKVEVHVTYDKTPGEGKSAQDNFAKFVKLYGDALTAEQKQKLIEVAGKCPVHRTLEATPIIKTIFENG